MSSRLAPTFQHPMTDTWSAAGGPWSADTLDDLLVGEDAVEARVAEVAGGLAAEGVTTGDAVSWKLPNGPDPIVLYRACWRLGAVAAPIHHRAALRRLAAGAGSTT